MKKKTFIRNIATILVLTIAAKANADDEGRMLVRYSAIGCEEDTNYNYAEYRNNGIINESSSNNTYVYCPLNYIRRYTDSESHFAGYFLETSPEVYNALLFTHVFDRHASQNFMCRVNAVNNSEDEGWFDYEMSSTKYSSGTGYSTLIWDLQDDIELYDLSIQLYCRIPAGYSGLLGSLSAWYPND